MLTHVCTHHLKSFSLGWWTATGGKQGDTASCCWYTGRPYARTFTRSCFPCSAYVCTKSLCHYISCLFYHSGRLYSLSVDICDSVCALQSLLNADINLGLVKISYFCSGILNTTKEQKRLPATCSDLQFAILQILGNEAQIWQISDIFCFCLKSTQRYKP